MEKLLFELRPAMEDIGSMFAQRASEKGIELIVRITPRVPQAISGDPGRLRQVLVNLVGNAIKFTEHGEVVVSVDVKDDGPREVSLEFSVSDSGIGIPPERLETVFEAFSQADASTTRRFGGTGLGLTISRSLVELMGGKLEVESEVGKGTTFRFTARFDKQADTEHISPCLPEDLMGKVALVVDDNETNRKVLVEQLKHFGLRSDTAADAEGAWEKIQRSLETGSRYDLAIVDYAMPGVDGEELGRRIRSRLTTEELPLIMLTSLGRRGDATRLRDVGFNAYLVKPAKQSYLLDAIMMVFGHDAQRVEEREPFVTRHSVDAERLRVRGRILVAEDNPMNQKVALAVLRKLGYTCEVVENGKDAVDAVQSSGFDLVLMDCQMPVMDGFEAARIIRSLAKPYCEIPIVAMTANAMQGDRERCLAAGMNDYATKPVDREALAAVLGRYLQSEDRVGRESGAPAEPAPEVDAGASVVD